MDNKFKLSDSIGDIVAQFPLASDVFYKNNIDFCCGGNRSLAEAMEQQKLNGESIIAELNHKYKQFFSQNNKFTDWAKETPSKLIDYIINTHHAYLMEELPKLSEYTLKILKVHGSGHAELFKVHKLFNALRSELEEHVIKEEQFAFPLIKNYEINKTEEAKRSMLSYINELEKEHTAAGDIIKELREETDHYTVPKDACRTFEITYKKLKELEIDLFQHIHLENNILFKNLA